MSGVSLNNNGNDPTTVSSAGLDGVAEQLRQSETFQRQYLGAQTTNSIGIENPLELALAPFVVGLTVGGAVVLFEEATMLVREVLLDDFVPEVFETSKESLIAIFGVIDEPTPFAAALPLAVLPLFGGAAVSLIRLALANDFGVSLKEVNANIANANSISVPRVVTKSAASVLTLGTGNALGPEGPVVELGGMLGTALYRNRGLTESELRLVLAGGCAAGLATGFNAPISAIFFALESILSSTRDKKAVSFTLLSAVSAALLKELTIGLDPKFDIPSYNLHGLIELPWFLLLGVTCGGAAYVFKEANTMSAKAFSESAVPPALRPMVGSTFVFTVALFVPQILFFGYYGVDNALQGVEPSAEAAAVLFALAGAKIAVTSVCAGSGLVGGVFAPSLFIGSAIGASFGSVLNILEPPTGLDIVAGSPAYALVGMASLLAATVNAPLTSILLLFEITRDYRAILPVMAGVAAATITENYIRTTLADTESAEAGLPGWATVCDLDALETIKVRDALFTNYVSLGGRSALFTAAEEMLLYQVSLPAAYTCDGAVVFDTNGNVTGSIAAKDLMGAVREVESELRTIYANLGGLERGGITLGDLKDVFKNLNMDLGDDTVNDLFVTLDIDGSGVINFDEFVRGASMLGIKGTNRSLNELFPNLCTTVDGVIHQDASLLDAVQLMGKMPPPLIEESSALSGIEFQFSVAVVERTREEAEAAGEDMTTWKEKVLGIVTQESISSACERTKLSQTISLQL